MIEEIIGDLLEATTTITDITGTRIRPGIASADDVMPFVIYELTSIDYSHGAMDGDGSGGRIFTAISCYADTYKQAADLRDIISDTVDGWKDDASDPKVCVAHVTRALYLPDGANPGNNEYRYGFEISATVPFYDYSGA